MAPSDSERRRRRCRFVPGMTSEALNRRQMQQRVNRPRAMTNFEMQMDTGRTACSSHVADEIALPHHLSFFHSSFDKMRVQRRPAGFALDHDHLAEAFKFAAHVDHGAVMRGINRSAAFRRQVDAIVRTLRATTGVFQEVSPGHAGFIHGPIERRAGQCFIRGWSWGSRARRMRRRLRGRGPLRPDRSVHAAGRQRAR